MAAKEALEVVKRILCFGDSNTWGANPADGSRHPSDLRWSGILQKELGEAYLVIEEGYNGRTTVFDDEIEGRLSGLKYFAPCIESQSPLDMIIIMLGTNDLKTRFGVEAGTIAFGLNRYLKAVQAVFGNCPKVLLAAPILIDPAYKNHPLFYDMFGDGAYERSKGFAKAYEAMAGAAGIYYMNAADFAKASSEDGIHMDAGEHEKLGRAFASRVKEILAKGANSYE